MRNVVGIRSEVLSLASGLEAGESQQGLRCPVCKGGQSGERSFGITRERHGVLYNCHRNSCSTAGFVPTAAWASDFAAPSERRTKHRPYRKATCPLGDEEYAYLKERFEVTKEQIDWAGWKFGIEDGRIIMPVRNSNGFEIGCMARSYDPYTTKKAIAYPEDTKHPWLCYYMQATDSTAVIVEDQVSALKLSKFIPSVALLGTGLNNEKVVDIASRFPNVLMWLDADARATAYQHREKYKLMFGNFIVHSMSNLLDPKDTSLVDINNILKQYKVV